jgi:ubiquinone/menaquinone biosynthesis C-methylase UbiE
VSGVAEWEPEAENWVRWARTPGHDAYWYYRDSFFELLPPPGARTIELGCGEGRVARDLVAHGHRVVGTDTASTLVRHAREADPAGSYAVADGAAVPCASGAFDLVVAYNSLQVVADMPGTVREAARLLRVGGHVCLTVSHPAMDLGRFVQTDSGVVFAVRPAYFESRRVEDTIEMDGLSVTCRGWTYTLEDYLTAFESAGLAVQAMREPTPTAPSTNFERWQTVPLFLMARLVKLGD